MLLHHPSHHPKETSSSQHIQKFKKYFLVYSTIKQVIPVSKCNKTRGTNTLYLMEGEDHIAQQLQAAFGTTNLYEIFGVPKDAPTEDIRRVYKKKALKYHPDKGGDAEVFKGLSVAHSILSNEEKRKAYDETGSLDEENSKSFDEWHAYFRNLFPKITVHDIEKFEKTYCGSEEERTDVLKEYTKHKGKLNKILESVMLAEEGRDEARICALIDEAISTGEIASLSGYEKSRESALGSGAGQQKRKKQKKAAASEESVDSLAAMIRARQDQPSSTATAMGNIFAKYGQEKTSSSNKGGKGKKKSEMELPEISDSEFERIQASMLKK